MGTNGGTTADAMRISNVLSPEPTVEPTSFQPLNYTSNVTSDLQGLLYGEPVKSFVNGSSNIQPTTRQPTVLHGTDNTDIVGDCVSSGVSLGSGNHTQLNPNVIKRNCKTKKSAGATMCNIPGCSKLSRGGSHLCVKHGGGKRCLHLDDGQQCNRIAQGRTNYCRRHGGGNKCVFDNCAKPARGGSNYCTPHLRIKYPKTATNQKGSDAARKRGAKRSRSTTCGNVLPSVPPLSSALLFHTSFATGRVAEDGEMMGMVFANSEQHYYAATAAPPPPIMQQQQQQQQAVPPVVLHHAMMTQEGAAFVMTADGRRAPTGSDEEEVVDVIGDHPAAPNIPPTLDCRNFPSSSYVSPVEQLRECPLSSSAPFMEPASRPTISSGPSVFGRKRSKVATEGVMSNLLKLASMRSPAATAVSFRR